jgi:hypothetical protein
MRKKSRTLRQVCCWLPLLIDGDSRSTGQNNQAPKKQKRVHVPEPKIAPSRKPSGLKTGWKANIQAPYATGAPTLSQQNSQAAILQTLKSSKASTHQSTSSGSKMSTASGMPTFKYGGFVSDDSSINESGTDIKTTIQKHSIKQGSTKTAKGASVAAKQNTKKASYNHVELFTFADYLIHGFLESHSDHERFRLREHRICRQ